MTKAIIELNDYALDNVTGGHKMLGEVPRTGAKEELIEMVRTPDKKITGPYNGLMLGPYSKSKFSANPSPGEEHV